jgi:histidinol dehydrogenase
VTRILQSKDVGRLLRRKAARLSEAEAVVRPILEAVRTRGDRALLEYARKFDGFAGRSVKVPLTKADKLSQTMYDATLVAHQNIWDYAERQMPQPWAAEISPGRILGQIVRPLDTVAAYIPAGRYPLPSTLLMTVVPAQVAGVPNVCVACPRYVPVIFGTARMLSLHHVYQMGGAQAIAAFAYGTKTVPRADRIVGPGNIYVAAAKKLLAGEVGIDFVAGPTEILIIATDGNPVHLAADMRAQAEHDDDAFALLLSTSKRLATAVAEQGLPKNCAIVQVRSVAEAMEISNRFAPEHLSIPDASLLPAIRHAGSVFIGPWSPEAAGDYVTGPNHVLPTNGAARIRGGLSVHDYLKVISTQELSRPALRRLAPAITTLARAEGLEWHARSVEVRVKK